MPSRNSEYQNVFFKPWIGENYLTSNRVGGPVLLLGWSHYARRAGWESAQHLGPKATIDFVKDHIEGGDDSPRSFWAKLRQAVRGDELSTSMEGRHSFWHSVAFYNYIQEALAASTQTPSDQQHKDARSALLEVLRVHQPKSVIVVGETLWRKTPSDGHAGPNLIQLGVDEPFQETWHYPAGESGFAVTSRIDHPSVRRGWGRKQMVWFKSPLGMRTSWGLAQVVSANDCQKGREHYPPERASASCRRRNLIEYSQRLRLISETLIRGVAIRRKTARDASAGSEWTLSGRWTHKPPGAGLAGASQISLGVRIRGRLKASR